MLSEKEVALLYETLLNAPGMNDAVTPDLRMPMKNVLLLAKVIEKGLQIKPGETLEGLLQCSRRKQPVSAATDQFRIVTESRTI